MTTRLAWATDIHLNFVSDEQVSSFCDSVAGVEAEGLVISGDIAEGHSVGHYLAQLEEQLERPVYFVLGNHDYYRSSFRRVHQAMSEQVVGSENLKWLDVSHTIELTSEVALLGHSGWADGRLGDYYGSAVELNDYQLIHELSGLTKAERFSALNQLGDQGAIHVRQYLPEAMEKYKRVYFVTHVPPFLDACHHDGGVANDDWLPHFACKAVGDALLEVVPKAPQCEVTVLSGHTHSRVVARMLPNLVVRVGAAQYGNPFIEEIIDI